MVFQSREQRDQLLCSRLLVLHLGRQEIVVLRPLAGPPEDQDQPSPLLLLLGELLLLLLLLQAHLALLLLSGQEVPGGGVELCPEADIFRFLLKEMLYLDCEPNI